MTFPNDLPERLPQPYSISVDEFKLELAPTEPQPYKIDDKVTRDNFTRFFITCFAVSRGSAVMLTLFLVWLKLRSGFDYSTTLTNFTKAGDWHILPAKEKMEFIKEYDKRPEHEVKSTEAQEIQVSTAIKNVVFRAEQVSMIEGKLPLAEIQNLKTFSDFQKFAQANHLSIFDLIDDSIDKF